MSAATAESNAPAGTADGPAVSRLDEPIFVGGLGRSGSHPVGRMLSASRAYFQIRTEVRFHASPGGLGELHRGEVTMEKFLDRMRGYFWERAHPTPQGLHKFTTVEYRDKVLAEFEAGFEADRIGASRRLMSSLLDPPTIEAGRPAWAELTAESIQEAPLLHAMYPKARFVNMIRDGRVIAAGAASKLLNMTDDPITALERWERIILGAQKSMSQIPADQVLTIHFDDMVSGERDMWFDRLADFARLDPGARQLMRDFFEAEIEAGRANIGRWRTRISPEDVRLVERRHRRIMRRLGRLKIDWVPDSA